MRHYFRSLLVIGLSALLFSCQKEFSSEGITINELPVADAGADQVLALPKDSVLLSGSSSYDPDGKIIAWKWIKISGPGSPGVSQSDSSITIVKPLNQGQYQFELSVTDDKGAIAKDTVEVTVNAALNNNKPPIACAGQDITIELPSNSVRLNGNCSSDPDNNISSYSWTRLSGPASYNIVDPSSVQTDVSSLAEGSYLFQLKVTDAAGLFSFDTVMVGVNPINNSNVDVYISGYSDAGALYWKNGQAVVLDASKTNTVAMAITVVGKDVYVAGDEGDFFIYNSNRAKYWKNGQEVYLTGAVGAGTTGITVDGTNIYVTGWELKGGKSVAMYWKNGQPVQLTNGAADAVAKSIVVEGGNVHVVGYDNDVATYWKNGKAFPLTIGSIQSSANSLAIVGSDVYVAGEESDGTILIPKYWKNGAPVALSHNGTNNSATGIVVNGSDVYISGFEGGYYDYVAKYWRNGQEFALAKATGSALALGIAAFGNDVYVVGGDSGPNFWMPKYWKNGQVFTLTGTSGASATDIALVPR